MCYMQNLLNLYNLAQGKIVTVISPLHIPRNGNSEEKLTGTRSTLLVVEPGCNSTAYIQDHDEFKHEFLLSSLSVW